MSLIDELHKLMKEKKYTFAYTANDKYNCWGRNPNLVL